jgi:hypothetical protein
MSPRSNPCMASDPDIVRVRTLTDLLNMLERSAPPHTPRFAKIRGRVQVWNGNSLGCRYNGTMLIERPKGARDWCLVYPATRARPRPDDSSRAVMRFYPTGNWIRVPSPSVGPYESPYIKTQANVHYPSDGMRPKVVSVEARIRLDADF